MTPILTIGEVMGLLTCEASGPLMRGSVMTSSVAGSEFNVAVALARLNVPTWFAGAVGHDVFGPIIERTLRAEGVDTRFLNVLADCPTGLMIKEHYGLQLEPRVHYYRRKTAMHQWVPATTMESALGDGWVHLSGISLMIDPGVRQRLESWLMGWTDRHPWSLSIDLNVRRRLGEASAWKEGLKNTLPRAGLIFAGRRDLRELWGTDDVAVLVADAVIGSDQVVIITDGGRGSQLYEGAGLRETVAAWPTAHVVDPVGAGDGFAAGVLAGRARKWGWRESIRLGSIVGAFAVSHSGDWEGYPQWDDAMAVLQSQWVDR